MPRYHFKIRACIPIGIYAILIKSPLNRVTSYDKKLPFEN